MKRIFSVIIIMVLCFTSAISLGINVSAADQSGYVNCDALNVRSGAGTTYTKIATLYNGHSVTVTGSANDSAGDKWYKISFDYSGSTKTGYVFADYITITGSSSGSSSGSTGSVTTDADFEKYMTAQGFPDSYKPMLRALHNKYPNWIFKAQHLGIDWNTALKEELVLGRNLVHSGAPASWKSMEQGAYNFSGGYWYGLDGGWVAASKEIIAYYLDPRNFINDPSIFMFENLSYNSSVHNITGVKNILANTFMSGNFTAPDTGKVYSYAQTFMDAAAKSGVSPYHLASRCRNEQGVNGAPQSLGTVKGYENYFNFFNIQAYATSTMTAAEMGCKYAMTTNPTYLLPWTNQYKAILGGSIWVGSGYITREQDTLYLQKFDMVDGGNGYYYHQYMTCIFGQENEAASIKKAYTTQMLNSAMEFKIPVYKNMPEELYKKPTSNGDNNNFLKSLTVSGYKLDKTFDKYTMDYTINEVLNDSSVLITAPALSSGAKVQGAGEVKLDVGTNKVEIKVTAPSGSVRTYTITVVRKDTSPDLDIVTGLKYTATTKTVELSWNKVSGAEGYIIYQYDNAKKEYVRIDKLTENTPSYKISGLKQGEEYKFAVLAYKFYEGKACYGDRAVGIATKTKIPIVTGLKVEATSPVSVRLAWDKQEDASGYIIYRYNEEKKDWTRVDKITDTVYSVKSLTAGKQYKFAVESFKTLSSTSWVYSEDRVEILSATNLSKVSSIKATEVTKNSATLSWSTLKNADGYILYRYDEEAKEWIRAGKTTKTSYTVTGLEYVTDYKFCVKGYKFFDDGSYIYSSSAPEVTVTTKDGSPDIARVTGLKFEADTNSVTLTWDKVHTAMGYIIYKYDNAKQAYVRMDKLTENTPTYKISGLKQGTEYKFAVLSYKFYEGKTCYGERAVGIKTKTKIPAVTGLKVEAASPVSIRLSWDGMADASGYIVYQYDEQTGEWIRVEKITDTVYSVKGLTAGKQYKFAVEAFKTFSSTSWVYSENRVEISSATNLSKVSKIESTGTTNNTVSLSWSTHKNADGYILYQYNNDTLKWDKIAETTDTIYTVTGLESATEYNFCVKGKKTFEDGTVINSNSGPTVSAITALPKVTGLKGTATKNSVKLSWTKQTKAEGYIIYKYNSTKGVYSRVKKLTTNTNSYTVSSLSANTSYKLAVKAYCFVGKTPVYSEDYTTINAKTTK